MRMAVAPDRRTFDDLIATRDARIGIVGLGYAGLPLGFAFAEAGFRVTGIDIDEERVAAIREHRSYLVDVPAERYATVDDRLTATTDPSAASELDAITICVPTPLSKTRTPDLTYVIEATESVAEHLSPGQLVVLQSTTFPGHHRGGPAADPRASAAAKWAWTSSSATRLSESTPATRSTRSARRRRSCRA